MFEHIVVPKPSESGTAMLTAAYKAAIDAPNPAVATRALMETLGKLFKAKRAYIYELPPEGTEFVCTCEWYAPGVEPMGDVTHGITMTMASRWFGDGEIRSLLAIKDLSKFAEYNPAYAANFAVRSMRTQICGKLMRGGRPMGVLGFDDPDQQMFDHICELMFAICAFAASAINTRNLLGRMRSAGMVDKLTGAGTRMGFYDTAEHLPTNISVGMAYLDIVGLQAVNDVYGHDAGDDLLVGVRQVLITEFKDDQVFRMSGDEFAIVVPGIGEHAFADAIKRIRMRLDELSVYVALGFLWNKHIGGDYDMLLRHAWLECHNAKLEWERRGGLRLEAKTSESDTTSFGAIKSDDLGGNLDIPCYHNDEFFRRAHIWMGHLSTCRVAVAALDINYFKLYNDIYGRESGDLLLETCGKIIARVAAAAHGVAGYLGGDNFALVFPVDDDVNAQALCEKAEKEIDSYAIAEGFSPSVGIVLTSDPNVGIAILHDRALVALQNVKGSYTKHVAFYDEGRYERERDNQLLLIQAQEGLAKGEFDFYLQPKVDAKTGKVLSAEALVRWIHNGEVVPPYRFVDLMENSGYIFALDRCVWESVCVWLRSLIDQGVSPVPVSVNVSRVDFYFTDLASHFSELVQKYDIPARLIGIEVTESAYSKDSDAINGAICSMQSAGFRVYMDDFGSGYSSLKMLRTVPVDVIKMDKGFIDNAQISNGSDVIIENVINMAHMMGLPVISEGVETKEQCDALRTMDCDFIQGYYYYRPMPKEEFEELLKSKDIVELSYTDDKVMSLAV